MIVALLIAAVSGYLLGALPFGYLVARGKGVNIFEVGSKNPGATNVRRVLGHGPGNLVLLLDAAKGALAAGLFPLLHVVAPQFCPFDADGLLALKMMGLVAAIVGHSCSCFTGFKGGKSVATGAGGFLVLFPLGMGIGFAIFGLTLALSRYVSLASMLAAASLPFAAFAFKQPSPVISMSAMVAAFVIYRHRANLARIRAGTESKVGQEKPDASHS
ncbi:MAG: glycerol-3-phosphate 1-O-acyltransferase PlsY [Verrucomicrobia bacterium]|nr:glycerol-3-phosphate 1-O-acyltransferase PlsY [Verrucomicrobiota bacterium]